MSPCLYTAVVHFVIAFASRIESMIDAWLSASEMTKSPSCATVAVSPSFAFHADTKLSDDSVPTNRRSLLELAMDRERAADEAHARRARAVALQSVDPRLDDRRLVAQPEVVVRRQDQHFAAPFHLHARRLRRIEVVSACRRDRA